LTFYQDMEHVVALVNYCSNQVTAYGIKYKADKNVKIAQIKGTLSGVDKTVDRNLKLS